MSDFVGRRGYMATLEAELGRVRQTGRGAPGAGVHLPYASRQAFRGGAVRGRGYWKRKGDVEVDLVGTEEKVRPKRVAFVGSIKWRERIPFGGRSLGRIAAQRDEVPGTDEDTVLVGVSREGFDVRGRGLDVDLVPEDLLEAWKR